MFKKILNFLLLSSITSAIFMLFFACSVGLGESVDTEVPKIEITYPPASSPVRDWFYLAGNCSDDKGVDSIVVSAKNISTDENFTLGTAIPAKDGTWQIKINEKDSGGNYKLKDGTYTFSVIATDSSKQQSAPNIRTLEIDNTAPVFVIKNPGTTKSDSPAPFGSILKIVGAAADEHEIYELELKVYSSADMSCEPKATLIEKNVDKTDGINVTLARYNPDVALGAAAADELHNNYLSIYNAEGGGDQQLFASVTLRDSAGVWQNPLHTSADSIGNSTSGGLYLNDDIYDELMGKKSKYGLTAADFMKIINGTYKNVTAETSENENSENNRAVETDSKKITEENIQEVLAILNKAKTDTSSTPLSFKLNKDANPTYEVMGFAFNDSEAETFASHKAAKKSSLTFKAQAGLDGTYIKPSTLKVYMFGPYSSCSLEQLNEIRTEPESYYNSAVEKAKEQLKAAGNANPSEELVEATANARILADYSENSSSSTETFTETIELPSTITKGSFYVLAASGKDIDGLSLLTQNNYGFVGESAGTPPAVSITGFADGVMKNSVSKIKVSGTLKSEETELAGVAYSVVVFDEIASKTVGTITGEVSSENFILDSKRLSASWKVQDILKGTLSYENGYAAFEPEDGKRFKYTVTVTGKDTTGLVSKDTRSFTVDRKVPEIKINDITPVAKKETAADGTVSKYIVNGKIKFSTVVTDTNLKNVKVTVTDGTKSETLFEGNSSTIEKEIDTTKYKDENFLAFKVEAEDSAENTASSETDVWVNQKTDIPEIKFTNGKSAEELGGSEWANVTNGQNVFGIENNNFANFSITDDDGLSLVRVTVFDENKKQIGSEGAVSVEDAQLQAQPDSENAKESAVNPVEYKVSGGSTTYMFAYKLPQKAGKYKILIEVFDTGHDAADESTKVWHTTKCENYVLVSEGNISISFVDITNNTCQVKAGKNHKIEGTVSLSSLGKLKSLERFNGEKITEEDGGTTWNAAVSASSKYPPADNETDETKKITVNPENGKLEWADTLPGSGIADGEQHFFYKATGVDGNSAVIELICYGDGNAPEVKSLADYTKWNVSSSVKLSLLAADIKGFEPSGISSVKYSYKKGETVFSGVLARGNRKYAEDGNQSDSGSYYEYSTTVDFEEGTTSIRLTAEDNVGNPKEEGPFEVKVDKNSPEKKILSVGENLFKKNTDSVQVSYAFTDVTSGISKIEFCTNRNFKTDDKTYKSVECSGAKDWGTAESLKTIDIPLTNLNDGEYKIYARATDVAGNVSSVEETGSFTVDTTKPSVKITSHTTAGTEKNALNKTVTFSGTVSDSNVENSKLPVLQYYNKSWKDIKISSFTCDGQNWSFEFDSSSSPLDTVKGIVAFQVAFTDKAGNTNLSVTEPKEGYEYRFKIDQDSDRPVLTFSDISDFENSIVSRSSFKGFISDDDGDVKGLWYIDSIKYDSTKLPSANNAGNDVNGWKYVKVAATTGDWEITLENEGENSFEFCAVDSVGTVFDTRRTSGLSLKAGGNAQTAPQTIKFTYDKTPPVVKLSYAHGTETPIPSDDKFSNASSVFGVKEYLYVKAEITENVGLAAENPLVLELGGEKKEMKFSSTSSASPYIYKSTGIQIEGMASGSLQIAVTAKDKAGNEGKGIEQITIDTEAPTVKIVSPTTAVSDAITGSVTIKGIAQDNASSVSKIQYLIPTVDQATSTGEISLGWKEVGNSGSWEIQFASGAAESSDSLLYYVNAEESGKKLYAVESFGAEGENIWKVPLYFKVSDSCGNEAIRTTDKDGKALYVLVDPDGGKPKVWVNSPEENSTTSGLVTVYGGASDDVSVERVELQFDANGDGKIDSADFTVINEDAGAWAGTAVKENLKGSGADWYILANGTNSWKVPVDTDKISESASSKKFIFKVRAYDGEKQTRGWSKEISVNIDSEVPVIKDLKVVQFGKNETADSSNVSGLTPVSEREYLSGMYISNIMEEANGTFYLVGAITDNSCVKSVTFEKQTTASSVNNIDLNLENVSDNSGMEYNLCVPLKTDVSGQINYIIKAHDDNTGETTQSVVINIDSTKPGMYTTSGAESENIGSNLRLKSLGKNLGTSSGNSTVVNSDSYFTFGDTVSEAGSGLAFVVAVFERSGTTGGRRIYNPMKKDTKLSLAENETEASISKKPYISAEGFAVQQFDVERPSEDSIKSAEFAESAESANGAFIQKGGLVRIAGTYCLITDFDSSTGKITLSKSVSKKFTTAEIIFGQVIDHQIVETFKADGTVENDDGDGMCETIRQLGASYTWTASVDSTNIPDGPINIHVVAIDNAGNTNYGYVKTKVENNRPRIAKVMLATDLNGNGKFDYATSSTPITGLESETVNNRTADGAEFGEFSFYSAMEEKSTNLKDKVALKSDKFNVIGGLAILPEFVGGNGDIWYVEKYSNDSSSTDYTEIATGVVNAGLAKMVSKTDLIGSDTKFANKDTNPSNVTYADLISEKGGIILKSVPKKYISFTFWDSTEETTPGTDSQWAHLMIPVTVLSSETEKPVPTITPFYWESKSENSVEKDSYGNLLGHIELEGDLTSELMLAYGDTVSLKKPKVSGKIKIEGTVTDNVRISSIKMGFDDLFEPTVLANYVGGSWQTVPSLPNGVVAFTVHDVSISQKGHEAKYTLVVDTEELKGVAGKDKKIVITATDWRNNTSVEGTAQTTENAKTARYRVDVVPYVTGIGTELSAFYRSASSVYARTSTGRYPLHEDESITFYGFNLGSTSVSPSVSLNGTALKSGEKEVPLSDIVGGSNKATVTTGTTATSGAFTVSVNSLQAINNMNDNLKEYNQQPNNVNNNTLNDDLYADVWQFKNAAEPINGKISNPHMKIGPSGEIGFSFSNAVLYYSMPGYRYNGSTSYSQTKMGMNYGGFTNNTFAYDKNGSAYGVALCIDTGGSPGMSGNLQFFSRKDGIGENLNSNYSNQKYARRIENTTVSVDGITCTTDLDRVLSPSMTTYINGNTSYVYLAYYDNITKQIRFRTGTVGNDANDIGGGLQDLLAFKSGAGTDEDWPRIRARNNGKDLYLLRDSISGYSGIPTATDDFNVNSTCGDGSSYSAGKIYKGDKGDAYQYVSVPAASGVAAGNSYYKKSTVISAGQYVAVGALSDGTAVLAWYDELNGRLAFSYNSSINSGYSTLDAGTTEWQSNAWYVTDSSIRAGWYVSMAVDTDNGVHLAYYSPSGADLYYSYIKNPKSDRFATRTVMVDSYQQVGTYCTIDVGRKNSNSPWIPYISYKCESNNGTSASAKVAYPVKFDKTNNVLAGVNDRDQFTGNWEVSIIPAITTPTTDFVNVGVNKDWSTGMIKSFASGNMVSSSLDYSFPVSDSTTVYGNGTSNPVVSYAVSENGVLEMAQKK